MLRIVLATLAIGWGCESTAFAQPAAVDPAGERLVLADRWMEHLDAAERKQFAFEEPFLIGFSFLAAGVWTGFAIYHQVEEHDAAGTLAMALAGGANVAAAIAELSASDAYEARAIDRWARAGNFAMLATAAALGAGSDQCSQDCSVLLGVVAVTLAAEALTLAAFEYFLPPLYVSRRYAEYRRLQDPQRHAFALDFLRAQAARERYRRYASSAIYAVTGITCVVLAGQLERGTSKQLMAGAGVVAFIGALVGFLQASKTTPRDQLLAGELPPEPEAF